jgi:flagellar hook-associated protein 3 FlgL
MRVTNAQIRETMLRHVSKAQNRYLQLEEQSASGRRVVRPADDPTATAMTRRLDAALSELKSFEPCSRQVNSRLETADAALGGVFEQLVRLQELAVEMTNGTVSTLDRQAASEEVEQLRDTMIGLANTKLEDEFIFGGLATDAAPFQFDGTYVGDPNVPEVEISPGVRVAAAPNGAEAFTTAGGIDVFAVAANVRDALVAGDADAVQALLDDVDQAQTQIRISRSRLGPIVSRVSAADEVRANLSLQLTAKRSDTVDVDLTETLSNLTLSSQSLEAALTVTARSLSLSLLDKIR